MIDHDRTKLRSYRNRRSHWMSRNPYWLSPKDLNTGRYNWYLRNFGDRYLTSDRES
jgi:hypothetical protein